MYEKFYYFSRFIVEISSLYEVLELKVQPMTIDEQDFSLTTFILLFATCDYRFQVCSWVWCLVCCVLVAASCLASMSAWQLIQAILLPLGKGVRMMQVNTISSRAPTYQS